MQSMFCSLMDDPRPINTITPHRKSAPQGVGASLFPKSFSEVSTLPLHHLSGPKEATSCAVFRGICQEVADHMDGVIEKFGTG